MREIVERPAAAESMGKRAREIVMSRYRWEAEAEKLLDLYRRLLADRPGHSVA
jgi:glycosyltransferase involved in cell wall biosynthesis